MASLAVGWLRTVFLAMSEDRGSGKGDVAVELGNFESATTADWGYNLTTSQNDLFGLGLGTLLLALAGIFVIVLVLKRRGTVFPTSSSSTRAGTINKGTVEQSTPEGQNGATSKVETYLGKLSEVGSLIKSMSTVPRKRKKAITIIVEKPVAPRVTEFLSEADIKTLRHMRLPNKDDSRWLSLFNDIIARDLRHTWQRLNGKYPSPRRLHEEAVREGMRNELASVPPSASTSSELPQSIAVEVDTAEKSSKLALPAEIKPEPHDVGPESSNSDASPAARNGNRNSSWTLDQKPSFSSVSSASYQTGSATADVNEPRRMTWDANEQQSLAKQVTASGKRRRKRNRPRSKSLTLGSSSVQVDASMPMLWPVSGMSLLPPAPPPGLAIRPPPGLDPPRKTILRADAPPFTPTRMSEIPQPPIPPMFMYAAVRPLTPTSRSDRSSTFASERSTRTTSSDGEPLSQPHLEEALYRIVAMRGTPTDDGHDADDEEESYYDEERPSVDLSFLE